MKELGGGELDRMVEELTAEVRRQPFAYTLSEDQRGVRAWTLAEIVGEFAAFTAAMEAQERHRVVGHTVLAHGHASKHVISTVFLGVDMSHTRDRMPVLWESMVRAGEDEIVAIDRYTSRAAAEEGHKALVAAYRFQPERRR